MFTHKPPLQVAALPRNMPQLLLSHLLVHRTNRVGGHEMSHDCHFVAEEELDHRHLEGERVDEVHRAQFLPRRGQDSVRDGLADVLLGRVVGGRRRRQRDGAPHGLGARGHHAVVVAARQDAQSPADSAFGRFRERGGRPQDAVAFAPPAPESVLQRDFAARGSAEVTFGHLERLRGLSHTLLRLLVGNGKRGQSAQEVLAPARPFPHHFELDLAVASLRKADKPVGVGKFNGGLVPRDLFRPHLEARLLLSSQILREIRSRRHDVKGVGVGIGFQAFLRRVADPSQVHRARHARHEGLLKRGLDGKESSLRRQSSVHGARLGERGLRPQVLTPQEPRGRLGIAESRARTPVVDGIVVRQDCPEEGGGVGFVVIRADLQ